MSDTCTLYSYSHSPLFTLYTCILYSYSHSPLYTLYTCTLYSYSHSLLFTLYTCILYSYSYSPFYILYTCTLYSYSYSPYYILYTCTLYSYSTLLVQCTHCTPVPCTPTLTAHSTLTYIELHYLWSLIHDCFEYWPHKGCTDLFS